MRLIYILFTLLFALNITAQNTTGVLNNKQIDSDTSEYSGNIGFGSFMPSGTPLIIENALKKQAKLQDQIDQQEAYIQEYIRNLSKNKTIQNSTYVIPIVFHVISPTSEIPAIWVSQTRVEEQLQVLNDAFAGEYNQEAFGIPNNTDIQFCFAVKDINGGSIASTEYNSYTSGYNGITYEQSDNWTNNDINGTAPYGQQELMNHYNNIFPANKYLNIYIVDNILNSTGSLIAGYSPMPDIQNPNDPMNGVVIIEKAFGTNYMSNPNTLSYQAILNAGMDNGGVLIHEMGHYFNLWHVFQGGCSDGDYCDDTYPQATNSTGCAVGQTSCSGEDNIHNFMDYSSDYCKNTFSFDQINRLEACVNILKPELSSVQNLVETGIIATGGCIEPSLETVIFDALETTICLSDEITINFDGLSPLQDYSFEFEFTNTSSGEAHIETSSNSPLVIPSSNLGVGLWNVSLEVTEIAQPDNNITIQKHNYLYIDDCDQEIVIPSQAQWYVDKNVGLDFSNWIPQQVESQMRAWESESSICDEDGNLILYTNGASVWDNNHTEIATEISPFINTTAGFATWSASKGTIVLQSPNPSESHLYYIFTISSVETYELNNGLAYTIMDMSTGAHNIYSISGVEQKNIPCFPNVGTSPNNNNLMTAEALAVTADYEGDGYWITVRGAEHESGNVMYNDKLLAFHLYNNVGTTTISEPVISDFYEVSLSNSTGYMYGHWIMEFSPNSKYFAISDFISDSQKDLYLYTFNNKSGAFKEIIKIQGSVSDASFSPNSQLLYYSGFQTGIHQVDLSTINICNNYVEINTCINSIEQISERWRNIQRAPNNKLYLTKFSGSTKVIGAINKPNEKNSSLPNNEFCFQPSALNLINNGETVSTNAWLGNYNDVTDLDLTAEFLHCSNNCTNEFHFTNITSGSDFEWTIFDNTFSIIEASYTDEDIVHSFIQPNHDYIVSLTVDNKISETFSVEINPNIYNTVPTCNINGPDAICQGSTVQSSYNTNHTNLEYEWNINNGGNIFTSNESVVELVWDDDEIATHSIELIVTDPNTGCTCSNELNLDIHPELTISIDTIIYSCSSSVVNITVEGFDTEYNIICSNDTNTYSENGLTISSYSTSVLTPGNWTITVFTTSCNPKSVSINIDSLFMTSNIGSIIHTCSNSCDGSATVFANGGAGDYTYQWDINANNQTSVIATNLCDGKYYVTVTDENNCAIINFVDILTFDKSVTQDGITLTANNTTALYQWIDCNDNGSVILGETNQSFTAVEDGTYAVVFDNETCLDTSNCYTIIGVDITERQSMPIKICPNPTNGIVNIQNVVNSTIKIYSLTGALIKRIESNKNNLTIDLTLFDKGTYLIQIIKNNKTVVKKISLIN